MPTHYIDLYNGNDANGGTSWVDAWKTFTGGATSARIAPGDEIRVSKTPDPVSIGNATWTNWSAIVTLNSARTQTIDLCESGWVAANASTVTSNSTYEKQGTNCVNITKASYVANTLYAYKSISTLDLSTYQQLSLWVSVDTALGSDGLFKVCLCSDTAGATVVDEFLIPSISRTNFQVPLAISRTGGGNLGASIQSVALYTGASAPNNGTDIRLDCIIASKTGDLNLTCLLTKDSANNTTTDGKWPIQSIDGTTVRLDGNQDLPASTAYNLYVGTSETTTTYFVQPYATPLIVTEDGTESARFVYRGGYNTTSGLVDGETVLSAERTGTTSVGIYIRSYHDIIGISMARGFVLFTPFGGGITRGATYTASFLSDARISMPGTSSTVVAYGCTATVECITGIGSYSAVVLRGANNIVNVNTIKGCWAACTFDTALSAATISSNNTLTFNLIDKTYGGGGIYLNDPYIYNYTVKGGTIQNASPACVYATSSTRFINVTMLGTEVGGGELVSDQHDGTSYFYRSVFGASSVLSTASTFSGATDAMVTGTALAARPRSYPHVFTLGRFAVTGGNAITISSNAKKSHATNGQGGIAVYAYETHGLSSDYTATLANNKSEQTLTLTFTPSADTVLVVRGWAYYTSGNIDVSFDNLTCAEV